MYRAPMRNPLMRVPVRMYRSPLVIAKMPGLGQFASEQQWLQAMVPGTPTGPIPIGTSATVEVTPDTTTVTGQGASSGYEKTTRTPQPSITDWLNANSKTVLWIAAIGLGVLVLGRLGR